MLTMSIKIVSFELGEELYGITVEEIGEILMVPEIAVVPNTESFIEGVINLRGNIVPITNLSKKFGLKIKKIDEDSKIIVIEDGEESVGVLVDGVNEVIKLEEETIEETPEISTGIPSEVFLGVLNFKGKMLILLDIKKSLRIKEDSSE